MLLCVHYISTTLVIFVGVITNCSEVCIIITFVDLINLCVHYFNVCVAVIILFHFVRFFSVFMLFSLTCCMRNRKHASIMHTLIVNHYWMCIPLRAHRALNHNPWCTCTPQETVREQAEKKQSRLKTLRRQLRKHTSATSWGNTSGVIANTPVGRCR